MKNTRQLGEELFSQRLGQIESLVRVVASKHRLECDERCELYSLVMLKIVKDGFAILRRFQGRASWQRYLRVVIQRVLLDHRFKEWGKWRPSVVARRLGATAIQLDHRINRDGLTPSEAIQDLLTRGVVETSAELESLAARIPYRPRRHFVPNDRHLESLPAREEADGGVEAAERLRITAILSSTLALVLRELSEDDRGLLCLRFGHGWTVRRIAASQNMEESFLYRRFDRILRRLRGRLESFGLS